MTKKELGAKRIDPETGRKFYDLNKDPIISPYTGKSYTRSFFENNTDKNSNKEEDPEIVLSDDVEDPELISLSDAEEDDDVNIPDLDDDVVFLEEEKDEDVSDIISVEEDDDCS